MNFVCFLILNAILLLRPEDLFPGIAGLRLYMIFIVLTSLLSLPEMLHLLSPSSLRTNPVTVCVLLYFGANLLSLVMLGRFDEAVMEFGPEFGKVIIFFLLLQAVVNTPSRFRGYVASLVVLVAGLVGIALAQFHGYTHFENIIPCYQTEQDPTTEEEFILYRLVSTGIFNDPNDLCLMLGLGILGCIDCASTSTFGWLERIVWLLPIALFVFAITETHSKGGLLGVMAGLAAYTYSRFGGPKALPYVVVGAAAIMLILGGRQASFGGGTAHERLMFWADGLGNLFSQPLRIPTGLGLDWFIEETGHVAHNSFVQAMVESGLLGGGAFLAAFYLGLRIVERIGRGVEVPQWVASAKHFGFALLIGYGMGCYSLTRNFVVPTYIALGLATVLTHQSKGRLPERFQISWRWAAWFVLFSLVGLVAIKFATQLLGQAGI